MSSATLSVTTPSASTPRSDTLRLVTLHKKSGERLGIKLFAPFEVTQRTTGLPAPLAKIASESVVISEIVPHTPAAGLFEPGDRITVIDGVGVRDPYDAINKLRNAAPDVDIAVGVCPALPGFNLTFPLEHLCTPAEEEGDTTPASERKPITLPLAGLPPAASTQDESHLEALSSERKEVLLSSNRARLERSMRPCEPKRLFDDDEGNICACVTIPADMPKGTKMLSVDVWPLTEPKLIVTKPIPKGLNPGDSFLVTLVERHDRPGRGSASGILNGSLARLPHGELDFRFEKPDQPLGLTIEQRKRGPMGRKAQLVVTDVKRGSWAERLGVPLHAAISRIDGSPLSGSAERQMTTLYNKTMAHKQRAGPVTITVLVPPPPGAGKSKKRGTTKGSLLPSFGFRSAASKASSNDSAPTPILATPADTDRSGVSVHNREVVQVM